MLPWEAMYSAYMPMVWWLMLTTGRWERFLFSSLTSQMVYAYGTCTS